MAKSKVTTTDLKQFAGMLEQNIRDFNEIESSMRAKLNSYDWRDNMANVFKDRFEQTKPPLADMINKMEVFIPYLKNKADILDSEYLNG